MSRLSVAMSYHTRPMQPAELALAIDWAAAEGWNPGLEDADSFLAADPDGFWVGLSDGVPVASLSAVRYGADFGFIGLYIVDPAYRRQGLGLRLWHDALGALGSRTLGLDGVVDQQHNYRRSGFEFAHRNIRYEGTIGLGVHDAADVLPLEAVPFDTVLAYDQPFFPADRATFLRAWLRQSAGVGRAWCPGGALAGYGVARPCRVGWKIGPLFADSPMGAQRLLDGLLAALSPGEPFWLDVPATHAQAINLVTRRGMRPIFETARMYRGTAPLLPLERTYGITSFELG